MIDNIAPDTTNKTVSVQPKRRTTTQARKKRSTIFDIFAAEGKKGASGLMWQARVYRVMRSRSQIAKQIEGVKNRLNWDEFSELMMISAGDRLALVDGVLGNDAAEFALVFMLFASKQDFKQFMTEATWHRLDDQPDVLSTMANRARSLAKALAPGHAAELHGVTVKSSNQNDTKAPGAQRGRRGLT